MKHCFITKQRTLALAFFTVVCSLLSFKANAQTTVDCSISTNCSNAACSFATNIEKGCRCFDGIDNDGDGRIDKADSNCATYYGLVFVGEGSNCSIVPPGNADPFDLINAPITSAQNTADTQSKVSVGDVDGDGIPDAVITSKWNSEMRVVATRAPQPDGTKAGDVKSDFNLSGNEANTMFSDLPTTGACAPGRLLFEHENLIADIDKDGKAELFGVVSNRGGNPETPPTCFYLVGFKYGSGDLIPMFKAVSLGTDRPGTFGIADMDGDGKAELYLRDRIYAAETGALMASAGGDWDLDVTSAPVAVNISGDNKMELVCGTKIYSIPSLSNRTVGQTPQTLTLLHDMNAITANKAFVKLMNDPVEYGIDTHSSCSVADIDRDGNVDVVISGALNSTSGPTTVFYWNVIKNTVSFFSPPDDTYANGWIWGTGRVNLGDANGDGKTDLSFMAGNKLWCMTTDATGNIIPLWTQPRTINDSRSGVLTVTIYDFNNDGDPEMVYRDSQILAVVDGATGQTLQWSAVCQSHTYTEGPIIADVNGDGGTDICVPCYTNSVAGTLSDIIIDNVGSGYTTASVTITGGGGTGATASVTLQGGKIKSIKITNAGSGYSSAPTITITGNGTGAAATGVVGGGSFSINDGLQQQALGQFRLYYSAANDWLPTRKVWNQPGYFVVNIKDNLQLPFPQLDQNLIYSNAPCPNGLPGPQMPMNVFLNQVPYLSADGCPVFPAPDLSFTGDNPDLPGVDTNGDGSVLPAVEVTPPICGNKGISVRFRIINDGDLPLTLNVPVSFWKADPTAATATLADKLYSTTLTVSNLAVDATLYTNPVVFDGTGGTFRLYIVLNNPGTTAPISLTAPSTTECRLDNNMYSVNIVPDPFTTTVTKLTDNFKCVNTGPNTGSLQAKIFKGATEDLDYSKYSFQWYVGPAAGPRTPIAGATNAIVTGLGEGTYSVQVTNIVNNCAGQFVEGLIVRTGDDPDVVITATDQTLCNPPNGSLTATVQGVGGNTGYSFTWTDISGGTLGINTSTATNMSAGNYKLIVEKTGSGCPKGFDAPPILPPNKPDAQASVLANVVDCINPNSGSVTADAVFNAVVQNPANYTFTWYFYNNGTGTRGSVLPAANGTGQTRTGLAAGYYQVTIRDNVTQCDANQTPIVQVTSQTVLPTALITRTGEQTSCDPARPNGVLTASGSGGTFVSPTDFTFEWFRGSTTQAAFKIPIAGGPEFTSGTKGEILNAAKGGGTVYTVRVTTPFNCSATFEQTVMENINVPVLTLAELSPNNVCDITKASNPYNGSIQATVTFAGTAVTLPDPNYKFTWYDGTTTTTLHNPVPTNSQTPILGGLIHGNYAATVERTDLHCLSVPKTVPVTQATILPVLSATSTGSNNCDPGLTPDGTVTVTVLNTVQSPGPFAYKWYAGNTVGVGALDPNPLTNDGENATAKKVGGPVGAPNQYTVRVTNTATGCVNSTTQFVADVSVIPVLSFGLIKPNSICSPSTNFNGQMNAQVDNIPAGYTIGDYTFSWFDGQTTTTLHAPPSTTQQLDKLDVGFYTVRAENTKTGCVSAPISNQVPNAKIYPQILASATGSNNCDPTMVPDGTVSYTVTNIQAGDAFSQQWYDGGAVVAGNELPAGNAPGKNGTEVTARRLGGPTGAPKPYTVFVTNTVTGCTNFGTTAVPDNSIVPVLTTGVSPNKICSPSTNFDGRMTVDVSNIPSLYTIADYDFTWRNASNAIIQGPSPATVLDKVDVGAYSVVGKNRLTGCISAPANNNVPNGKVFPDLSVTSKGSDNCIVDALNNINHNGEATVTIGVTPGPHTIQWYTGSGDPLAGAGLPVLGPGHNENGLTANFLAGLGGPNAYTVRVVDTPSGCASYTTAFVADESVTPVLSFGLIKPNTFCSPATSFDGELNVQVDNLGTYALTDYAFTWYDGSDRVAPLTDPLHSPQPSAAVDHRLFNLDVDPYTVVGYNTKTGCTSEPITGQVPDGRIIPLVSVTTTGSHNCINDPGNGIFPDGTATATVTNNALNDPMSYTWSAAAPATALTALNTPNAQILQKVGGPTNAPNAYEVLVTNSRTGCFSTGQGLVADLSQKPIPTITAFENHVCDPALATLGNGYDGHVDITGVTHEGAAYAGAVTYKWYSVDPVTNVVGAQIGGATTNVLPNRPAGKYAGEVRITALGCVSDPVIREVLDDLTPPDLDTDTDPNTNCPGGLIDANGIARIVSVDGATILTPTYGIKWYNGATATGIARSETGNEITEIQSGTFTAEATNKITGCVASEAMTVVDLKVTPVVAVSLVQNNTNCTGTANGALLATPTDAGANFTVTWTPAVTVTGTGNINNTQLPADAYSATVRNNDTGCVSLSDGMTIIDSFTYPNISIAVQDQTTCSGTPNGMLTASAGAGVTYTWRDGIGTSGAIHPQTAANSGIINQLASDDYTVHAVINATGCASTKSEFVPNNLVNPIVSFAGINPVTSCNAPNGSATAVITDLSAPTSYDIYYVNTTTLSGAAFPTDPDDIKNPVAPLLHTYTALINQNAAPAAYGSMFPGYLTALVVDRNTLCESTPATVQIVDNTVKSNIAVLLTAAPGTCLVGGGGMDPTVTPLGNASYSFEWYAGSPTNTSPINFFNNAPTFATGQIYGDGRQRLGINGGDPTINAGTYTLVVRDAQGCGAYKTDNVPTTSLPVIEITPVDRTRCDIANGQISVNISSGGSVTGYSIEIFSGFDNTGTSLASIPLSPVNTLLSTTATLPEGPYYIEVVDGDAPSCPLGEVESVDKIVLPPVVTLDDINPNTACDANTSPDGEVDITVTTANGDTGGPKVYQVFNITPAVAGFATPSTIGTGLSGQSTGYINGFAPASVVPSYTITVRDATSRCATDLVVTVPDQQSTPSAMNVAVAPETMCAPSSNGSALASLAGGEPSTLFNFEWFKNNNATGLAFGPVAGNVANTAGQLLNQSKVAVADWSLGATGLGAGDRTFYVQGTKNDPLQPGFGCKTQLVQVVIPDQHISPDMTLTPFFDSFCLATAGNNLMGDGKITVVPDANPGLVGNQMATGGFSYTWTPAPIGQTIPPPNVSNAGSYDITQLHDGNYTVTATSQENLCRVQNTTTIAPAPYVLTIDASLVTDQRICNNDGKIEITQVSLTDNSAGSPNSSNDNSAAVIDNKYTFQWYTNAAVTAGTELEDFLTPADITTRILSNDVDGDLIVNEEGDYGSMQAGTYYVIATRINNGQIGSGCPSLPYQVVVNDVHKNPVPSLAVLSNTSCLPAGPGEGQINISVTDASGAPFNTPSYSYDWLAPGPILPAPNVDPTPVANGDGIGADDEFVNLIDNATLGNANPYTVRITNTVTGCVTNAFATIIKNATPVFVQSVVVTDEILCGPTGDGSLTVTRVTLNDRNGNEEEFVPTPGAGQGNINNFSFTWTRNGNAGSQTTAGNVLNSTNYDGTAGGFGAGSVIGAGTYTVTASRTTGSPGAGCPSAPFQVTILDKRIYPVASLTPLANTSCATLATDMEGEIKVKVTDATTATGAAGFAYAWTTGTITPIAAGTGDGDGFGGGENDGVGIDNDNDHPVELQEGAYALTVTSNKSGCQSTASTTILKNSTPIFIQDVAVLNQILCGPDGQLTVSTVTLNDREGNTQTFPPNISDFQFTWTRTGIAGSQVTAGTTLNASNYVSANFAGNAFGLGEYTVVARRNTNGPGNGCSSAPYSVSILDRRIFPVVTLTPFANTSCSLLPAQFEGEIEVRVTDLSPAVGPAGFDYTWGAGTGTAITSNNLANDGDGLGTDGDDDNPQTLREGTYSITVLSNKSGCSSTAQTEIFKNSTPVFTQLVTPTDQVLCSADGRLVVNEVRVIDRDQNVQSSLTDFPISNFEFTYSRTTVGNTIAGVTGTQLNVGNYPTIGADTYFVVARRTAGGPGLNCVSPPYKVDILNKQLFPVVSLTPLANTSCDPSFFEGEIEVRVTDNSVNLPGGLAPPFSYAYNWTTSATPAAINGPVAGVHDGDGSSADGDRDNPRNLQDGNYVIQVRNTQTNCISTGSTEIFKNSTPVFTQLVTPTHQVLCNPDGSLVVNEVKVIDRDGNIQSNTNGDFPLSDFVFTYDRATIGNTVLGPVPASTLNNVNYTGIGFDSYFVVATRVAGGPGRDCSSAPYRVEIEDKRKFPTVNFSSLANSSCNVAMPNGQLRADALETNGTNTGPYTFNWTLNAGALSPASTVNNTVNSSTVVDALDGAYIVTATNTVTGCPFDASFNLILDQTRSTPNIIRVDVTPPLDCNPSATARVMEVTLGSTTNSVLFPPNIPPNNVITGNDLLNLTFSWYKDGTAPSNQLPAGGPPFTTPCIGPGCGTPTPGIAAGTYFVTVLDPNTDCQSGPKEVIVDDDDIIYPVVEITQTKLQVSCISGVGSAELQATADGFNTTTNPSANYTFAWFRNLDATPPSDITGTSTYSNLVPGNYSVEVQNLTTGCFAEQLYIVPDDKELFRPEISWSTDPRVNCLTPDGTLLLRELAFDQNRYPFPAASFTAEIYQGANADITAPGTVMPVFSAPARTWLSTGLDGLATYTVKITDNNTGCIVSQNATVQDGRTPPIVEIDQDNPLINCDPARPNGQFFASADGGLIGGYSFDWYRGTTATGTQVSDNNIASGLSRDNYTVRVTNDLTGCFADQTRLVDDGRLPAPTPDAEVVFDRTHCIMPDGWVKATVGGVTINYSFDWYDGETATGTPDFNGSDYIERPEGFYTVKAMDNTTGCYSEPVTVEVLKLTEIPQLTFTTTPSFCEDLPDNFAKGNGSVQVDIAPAYLFSDSIAWVPVQEPSKPISELKPEDEGTLITLDNSVYTGAYVTDLYPGFYKGEVTTVKGCRNWGVAEVKTEIRAYNLVTRNSDGKNDAFVVDCISRFPNNNVKIFNRAGVKVYEADGYDNNEKVFRGLGERGVYTTGNDLPVGTYFYIIDKRDGSKPRTGYLELVK